MYKESSSAKLLKKACRRKRKGNEDNEAQEGGKMYAAGQFDEHGPDVTICPPCKKRRM